MSLLADWSGVFSNLEELLPLDSDPDFITGSPSIIRRLYVDLPAIAEALARRPVPHAAVEIYADVARISEPCKFPLCSLKIHTRRLEVRAGALLALDNRIVEDGEVTGVLTPGRLEVSAGELVIEGSATEIPMEAFGLRMSIRAGEPAAFAADYVFPVEQAGLPATARVSQAPEIPAGDLWAHSLQLMEAERLASSPPEGGLGQLPLEMARWVNQCAARARGEASYARLFGESAALINRLTGPSRHLNYVPYLNRESYLELAEKTLASLRDVESRYGAFFDRKTRAQDRVEQGEQMLVHYENARRYSDKLLAQAQTNMDRAARASDEAGARLAAQRELVELAAEQFDTGVAVKTKQAQDEMFTAVAFCAVAVGAAVAMACMGNPAGIGPLTEAAQKAKDIVEQVERLKQTMSKIAKIIDTLKKIGEAAQALAEIASKIKHIKDAFDTVTRLENILDELSGSEPEAMSVREWEVFEQDMAVLFARPVEWEIEGAQDYLKQLNILAIRGKDACDTGLHHGVCVQAYQRLLWETQRDQADIQATREQLACIEDRGEINFATSVFYQRLRDDLRGRLVLAIQDLNASYRYFALAEPGATASMSLDARTLSSVLTQASEEVVEAKEHFNPKPSTMEQSYAIDTADALQKLRDEGRVSFHIPMTEQSFPGFFRLRVRELKVWLIGARHRPDTPIYIALATSGHYQDRLQGRGFEFASLPMNLSFIYEYADSGRSADADPEGRAVTIKGRSDDDLSSYFEPTPFTTWTVHLPQKYNQGLDLSELSRIHLDFSGTYVGMGPMMARPRQVQPPGAVAAIPRLTIL